MAWAIWIFVGILSLAAVAMAFVARAFFADDLACPIKLERVRDAPPAGRRRPLPAAGLGVHAPTLAGPSPKPEREVAEARRAMARRR